MQGKIFEIKRFAVHDGDGIRTTVFLKGCPLKCVWCHNPEGIGFEKQLSYYDHKCVGCGACAEVCPEGVHTFENGVHKLNRVKCKACGKCEAVCLSQALKLYGEEMSVDELLPLLLEDREFYENSNGGVTLSGGECLMQADFCAELLRELKAHHIHTAVDTCGFVSKEAIEIRIPYVPKYNSDQIEKIAECMSELKNLTKVRVLPYHNYAGAKYEALGMENCLPKDLPEQSDINAAMETIKKYGIKEVM